MIARMKRVTVIVPEASVETSLEQLRETGLVHVERGAVSSDSAATLETRREGLRRELRRMDEIGGAGDEPGGAASRSPKPRRAPRRGTVEQALRIASSFRRLGESQHALRGEIEELRRKESSLAPWGDFDPRRIAELAAEGVYVHLSEMDPREAAGLPPDATCFVLSRSRRTVRVAVVASRALPELPTVHLPQEPVDSIRASVARIEGRIERMERAQGRLARKAELLRAADEEIDEQIELLDAAVAVQRDGPLAHLSGYVPARRMERLCAAARAKGWGLVWRDPDDDDQQVPTQIEAPAWLRIVKPVFDFLGTVPGYREHDISLWFLVFFSIFFAMLIGDAGYGLLFLAGGLAGLLVPAVRRGHGNPIPTAARRLLTLTSLMGGVAVVWGAMTGTWFGIEALSRAPVLRIFVVPAVASFTDAMHGGDTTRTIMHLCFIIGAAHLSIARILAFMKSLPAISAPRHLGWIALIWGMYFVARMFVLGDPMHPAALPLVVGGFAVVVLFSEQGGGLLRGFGLGLAKAPLKVLSAIGAFSDVVSYVRLFAVGLATLEVARAFNTMATGSGFGPGSVLILLFGHVLNIVLASMALLVHGVRLNMLEFSGHLEMEWTGTEYRPLGWRKSGLSEGRTAAGEAESAPGDTASPIGLGRADRPVPGAEIAGGKD